MGGAGIGCTADAWASFRNPAACAAGREAYGFSWSREFGIPELTRGAIAAERRVRGIPVGLQATTFGWPLYRESGIGVAVARKLGERFSGGVEIGGRFVSVDGYGSGGALAIQAGMIAELTREVVFAAVWRNANRGRISAFQDRLPESLTIGLATEPAAHSRVLFDLVQERGFPAEVRFGAEIRPLLELALRVGTRAEPVRPSAGFSVERHGWSFHYAGDLHPDLGATHQVGLEFHR
jgi:hypothetical protein